MFSIINKLYRVYVIYKAKTYELNEWSINSHGIKFILFIEKDVFKYFVWFEV
jgi:hypothetical protein